MEGDMTEKEKERMAKAANYPWGEVVGEFEMTEVEKKEAREELLRLIDEFGEKT